MINLAYAVNVSKLCCDIMLTSLAVTFVGCVLT